MKQNKILLNDVINNFGKNDLPCLISYAEGAGGSHFSVVMVADMFLRGSKIVFLTAFPMAKDEFFGLIVGNESKANFVTSKDQIDENSNAIILESGNEKLLLEAIEKLGDIGDRIIFIKNIEVFSDEIISKVLDFDNIILSGDIDKSSLKEKITNKKFETKIIFSQPEIELGINLPKLEKYSGYFVSSNNKGIIKISDEK